MSKHAAAPPNTTSSSTIYLTTTTTTTSATLVVATSSSQDNFDENSPRPPVLGEEQERTECTLSTPPGSTWGMCPLAPGRGPVRYSPCLTPRRAASNPQDPGHCRLSDAPLGFEPEGSERATPGGGFMELGTPPYLRWAISLASLLEDPDGVVLFKQYLEVEGSTDMLDFWFACEGLKNEARDDANVAQLVRLIHKRYFKASSPIKVNEALKKEVFRRVREVSKGEVLPDRHIFDEAQKQVEFFINDTAYPEFLRSETYLQHVRNMQSSLMGGGCIGVVSGGVSGSEEESSSSSSSLGKEVSAPVGLLPTLHEDAELEVAPAPSSSHHHHHHHSSASSYLSRHHETADPAALPLTRDMLMATQKKRASDLRPKPEAYARLCLQKAASPSSLPNPYHMPPYHRSVGVGGGPGLTYSSYVPVSRQDSELQSLSSDAHTEDSASVTNSSLDGSMYRSSSKRHQQLHSRQMRESASHNRDPHMHHSIIPRTQRIPRENVQPLKPDEFAAILIQKLENLQREQESQEKFERKILEGENVDLQANVESKASRLVVETHRERLHTEKVVITSTPPNMERLHFTDDQSILDMHVSRIWSDLTPSRSPGIVSPRPRSPEGRKRGAPSFLPLQGAMPTVPPIPSPMVPQQGIFNSGHTVMATSTHSHQTRLNHGASRHGRKDKDGVSNFSSDSGNVHDYSEGSEHRYHHMPKSKSMPDYVEAQNQETFASGLDSRMFAKESPIRKIGGGSRKALTELTDSGVSVVSDTLPCISKETNSSSRNVISWLMQAESQKVGPGVSHSHSDSSSKHRGRHSGSASASSGGNLQRQARGSKKSAVGNSGSRSGSMERSSPVCLAPTQPFVADPSMPPLPLPNTATQLEEARRRLEGIGSISSSSSKAGSSRQRFQGSKSLLSYTPSMSLPLSPSGEPSGSGQSTLRRHPVPPPPSSTSTLTRHLPQSQQPPHQQTSAEVTTIVFSFCDEEVPYRTKAFGKQITLRQFKELLPKRGNYRYFFKTECEDVDVRVIQEEVMEDGEILPLWEGKIMAQVKPVE